MNTPSREYENFRSHRRTAALVLALLGPVVAAGCNAVLGIEEAALLCPELDCSDAGRGLDTADNFGGSGLGGASAGQAPARPSTQPALSSSDPANLDAGADGSVAPQAAVNGSELPAGSNAMPPGTDVSSGAGDDDAEGNAGDDDDDGAGDDDGSGPSTGGTGAGGSPEMAGAGPVGSGGGAPPNPPAPSPPAPSPPPPPSPCDGRASGAVFCDGTSRISCGSNGVVQQTIQCLSAAHCQQGSGAACAVCLPNESRCDGAVLLSCNATGTGFDTTACRSAGMCNANPERCSTAACEVGEARCRGARLQFCNELGVFQLQETCDSPQACNAQTASCNVCSPGTVACFDVDTIAACDASGASETLIDCGALETCVRGECVLLGPPLL